MHPLQAAQVLTELKQEEMQEIINNEATECCYCLT